MLQTETPVKLYKELFFHFLPSLTPSLTQTGSPFTLIAPLSFAPFLPKTWCLIVSTFVLSAHTSQKQ